MKKKFFLFLFFSITSILFAQTPAQLADSVKKGFRGLSVVNENVVWTSGPMGLVGTTDNACHPKFSRHYFSWEWNRVKGFENSDFRSIYAFDKKNAVIANAGYPASILFTTDGGKNWTTTFQSKDSAMFFDGIDFWLDSSGDNQHGMIFGDPVNGRMYLSETFDGGKTWKEIPFDDRPQLQNGEASFAASGTTIRTLSNGHIFIATGGVVSRLWHSRDYGHHWEVFNTPMLQGKPSQGIFSIAFSDTLNGIIVGGDYLNDTLWGNNYFTTSDGGKSWTSPNQPVQGYFSCVEYISVKKGILATGTFQAIYSYNEGKQWELDMMCCRSNTIRKTVGKNNGIYGATIFYCGGENGFTKRFYSLPEPRKKKR